MNKILNTILIFTLSAIFVGCGMMGKTTGDWTENNDGGNKAKTKSPYVVGSANLASIYNPAKMKIHPNVIVKKNNLNDIDLYVNVDGSELKYVNNQARLKILYRTFESFENNLLLDSSSTEVSVSNAGGQIYSIKMKLKPIQDINKFIIQTTITDMYSSNMAMSFNEVEKLNPYSADNFMVTPMGESHPFPFAYAAPNTAFRVDYLNTGQFSLMNCGYRPLEPQVTLSPYASDPAVEDTTHFFNIEQGGTSKIIKVLKPGLYSASTDTNENGNLVIPCFGPNYPHINTPEEMIKPLAYLCTPEEYLKISESKTKKLAVDEFWYYNSHDLKKAKEQIKVYYLRAMYANKMFSDYREGVLTDRGMLYVVFGPPRILSLTSDGEIWTYIDGKNGQQVKFTFRKQRSRLCNAKYVLRRSTEYKPYWDKAVSTWRKGNVYTF